MKLIREVLTRNAEGERTEQNSLIPRSERDRNYLQLLQLVNFWSSGIVQIQVKLRERIGCVTKKVAHGGVGNRTGDRTKSKQYRRDGRVDLYQVPASGLSGR